VTDEAIKKTRIDLIVINNHHKKALASPHQSTVSEFKFLFAR
jgi:hypothetical protein